MLPLTRTDGDNKVLHQLVLQRKPPYNVYGVMAYCSLRYVLAVGFDKAVADARRFVYVNGTMLPQAVFGENSMQHASCKAMPIQAASSFLPISFLTILPIRAIRRYPSPTAPQKTIL